MIHPIQGEEPVARSAGCVSTSHGSLVLGHGEGGLPEVSLSRLDLQRGGGRHQRGTLQVAWKLVMVRMVMICMVVLTMVNHG